MVAGNRIERSSVNIALLFPNKQSLAHAHQAPRHGWPLDGISSDGNADENNDKSFNGSLIG